jgi:hypothetical protein
MDAELKAKWVAALRSGEHTQAQGVLKAENGSMCCLGVLAHVMGAEWNSSLRPVLNGKLIRAWTSDHLSKEIGADIGLAWDDQQRLAEMNDAGTPFSTIADWIEKNVGDRTDQSTTPTSPETK